MSYIRSDHRNGIRSYETDKNPGSAFLEIRARAGATSLLADMQCPPLALCTVHCI